MTDLTATPETGPVDAPVSMDSVLAEFDTGNTPDDPTEDAVKELVEQADGGDADAPDDSEDKTETADVETEEANDDTPEEPESTDDPVYTVKVNGADQEVPLSELLKGYSRTEDYKAKTMALAEERRGLESTITEAYETKLKQATDLFVKLDPVLAEANQIDWQALAQADPATYTQLRAAVDARMQALGHAQSELQQLEQQRSQQAEQALSEGIEATEAAIRASDPAFADDAKFASYVRDTVGELGKLGLDDGDVKAVLANKDAGPAILSMVHDAMRYRAQQKARAQLPQKKVVPVSQAKPMKSAAADSSSTPRKLPRGANTDTRAAFVVNELLEGA